VVGIEADVGAQGGFTAPEDPTADRALERDQPFADDDLAGVLAGAQYLAHQAQGARGRVMDEHRDVLGRLIEGHLVGEQLCPRTDRLPWGPGGRREPMDVAAACPSVDSWSPVAPSKPPWS
jgi:hypothetical protein